MVKGILYLCATPIGNLEDVTLRVLRVLEEADLIAAEDTRQTRKLLAHYGLKTPLTSYHEHNKRQKTPWLLTKLQEGSTVALVSDAGLPGISDPGADLVAAAVERGIRVEALPGPSAGLTALLVSGLPTERFVFEGFLPRSGKKRRQRWEALAAEERTIILYESPHRLLETLAEARAYLGERPMACCRELTKQYEEVVRGTIAEVQVHFSGVAPRGEFTLVIKGIENPAWEGDQMPLGTATPSPPAISLADQVARLTAEGWSKKEAIREIARRHNLSRREVYAATVWDRKV